MSKKDLFCSTVEVTPHRLQNDEIKERLEQVAEILYEYYCQLQKVNPTEDCDTPSLSNDSERTG